MDKIDVSQRAREKAWAVRPECYCEQDRTKWMAGVYDHVRIIQAFARFERDILATRTDATPVATDVAALVEAARAFAKIDLTGSGLPPDFAMNVLAIRAALAPFTKGQTEQERKAWGGGTVMTQTLEQLSATADKDPLKHGMSFLAALETAYRTGQLVAVQPDDATVERMQEAYATFGQTGHLRTTPPSPSPKQP